MFGMRALMLVMAMLFGGCASQPGTPPTLSSPAAAAPTADIEAQRLAQARNLSPEFERIFGKNPNGGPEDPFTIVERIDHGRLPAIRIDCGTADFLIDQNRKYHKYLESLHIPHEYQEFPGSHDWAYWDLHVQEAIAFHVRNLGLKKS